MQRRLIVALFLSISLVLAASPAAADSLGQRVPEVQWSHIFADGRATKATAVVQAPDGGYVYAGTLLVKLDAAGNTEWVKELSGSAADIKATADGGYIVAGSTTSADVPGYHAAFSGFAGLQPVSSMWAARYSARGELQWQRAWGGSGFDNAAAVVPASGGGYVVVGTTSSLDGAAAGNYTREAPGTDPPELRPLTSIWVLRLDSSGTLLWQRFLGSTATTVANANGLSVAVTQDGGYAVAGRIAVAEGDRPGYHVRYRENGSPIGTDDAYLVKLSSAGDVQWERFLGGTMDDWAQVVRVTADGGYILAGYTGSDDGDVSGLTKGPRGSCHASYFGEAYCRDYYRPDAWVVKLSAERAIQWQKTFGGPYLDQAHDIIQTADGGYFFVGEIHPSSGVKEPNFWAVKLSAAGEVQWQETFGGSFSEVAESVVQTADGGYALAGNTTSNDGDAAARAGYRATMSAWVIKLGPVSLGPSAWAEREIDLAREYGLVTERVLRNYQSAITREEFSELAVLLYEALSGRQAGFDWPSPFTDTDSQAVLKAYRLGIVAGVGEGLFAPKSPITREQIAVMFQRTLTAALPDLPAPTAPAPAFHDSGQVAAWARAAVDDLSARGIIGGTGDGRFEPRGTATREQAIALLRRVFEAFRPQ